MGGRRTWFAREERTGHDERALVEGLRRGDEDAFLRLVDLHGGSMLRVARSFVPTYALAEEVVQEAWLGVIRGIHGFEER